jgi:predicted DNA-binding protein
MLPMTKPKKKSPPDRHKSSFMIRLPEQFRELLSRAKAKTRRATTTEVQIALEKHLAELDLWPPTGQGKA